LRFPSEGRSEVSTWSGHRLTPVFQRCFRGVTGVGPRVTVAVVAGPGVRVGVVVAS
jgi:hypothetical protein